MSEFQETYLTLLRRQVDEEIAYLVQNGHDNDKIYVPCMFCAQQRQGHYACYRLNELRQFQSSIISNQTTKLRQPAERKQIGYENPVNSGESFNLGLTGIELKPMYPKL